MTSGTDPVGFLHSSSKSSRAAGEWFFVLAPLRLWTSFCRSPVTLLAKFSLWTVQAGYPRRAVFHPHVPSVFLPLEPRSRVVMLCRHWQREIRTTARKQPHAERPPHRGPDRRADLDGIQAFIDIATRQREDVAGSDAHRTRFCRCSRTSSPFQKRRIP